MIKKTTRTTVFLPTSGLVDLGIPPGNIAFSARDVESSNIEWIAWPKYDKASLMIVEFKGGARYAYIGVSRQKAVACAYAKSSGHYLNTRIKPHYEVVKLR